MASDDGSVGRNDDCPCGSGLKFKRCCMNKAQQGVAPDVAELYLRNYRIKLKTTQEIAGMKVAGRLVIDTLRKVEELIKGGLNVKLVIVDSLTAHFRAEFVGRGTLADRQQKLNKHMHILAKLADMYNLTVYVTNQVMAKPDTFFGDPTEAIGGNIVGHNSTFRIYLRKGKKGSRVAKLVDAPNIADGECAFFVKEDRLEAAV